MSANTTLKKLSLTGSQDYMSAVLHVLGTSAGSITDLDVSCAQFSVEGEWHCSLMLFSSMNTSHF